MLSPILLLSDGLHVGRLRLHGAADGAHARHRIEAQLLGTGASSLGLPAHTLLFVRQIAPKVRVPITSLAATQAFAQAVRSELDRQASKARRPWLHADAAAADAVLFTDEAELVACLVRDWLGGVATQRWWWRGVLNDAPPATWLQRHVLARGEVLVPVAVRLMEGASSTVRATASLEAWFARLDEAQVQEALASVKRAFALMSSPTVTAARFEPDFASADAFAVNEPQPPTLEREDNVAVQRLLATVPELRDSALAAPQRRLFAQVLAVVRSPAWARTPQLTQALSRIEYTLPRIEPCDGDGDGDGEAPQAPSETERALTATAGAPGDAARTLTATPHSQPLSPGDHRAATPAQSRGDAPPGKNPENHAATRGGGSTAPTAALTSAFEEPASPSAPAAMAGPEAAATLRGIAAVPANAGDVYTGFGGLFYLLNAALALGLYGDFTMPRARGLALSPWDWLALIGRAWFGKVFARDPVWPLLAMLAGRSAALRAGFDFDAPTAWTMDPSWLQPWGPVNALWVHATRTRLCVRHAAGFLVFDVPRDAALRPLAQARALCAAHALLRNATLSCARLKSRALPRLGTARWLQWMLGYLDARLMLTLGADDDIPSLVCRHAARVTASARDVNVALHLADLPLSIRVAGLDRDPGWIPAAGRAITFQFT